jgi:putative endopeptidase
MLNKLLLCALGLFATMAVAVWRGPDLAGMDPAIAPGNDFFAYTNGAWLEATEIPADRSRYGTSAMLSDLTTRHVNELLEQVAKSAPPGSEAQQLADTYASFMDEATIEAKGVKPLLPALARIDAIANRDQLSAALGATLRADVDVLNSTKRQG